MRGILQFLAPYIIVCTAIIIVGLVTNAIGAS